MAEAIKMGGGDCKVRNGTIERYSTLREEIKPNSFVTTIKPKTSSVPYSPIYRIDGYYGLSVTSGNSTSILYITILDVTKTDANAKVSQLAYTIPTQQAYAFNRYRVIELENKYHYAVFCTNATYAPSSSTTLTFLVVEFTISPNDFSITVNKYYEEKYASRVPYVFKLFDITKGSTNYEVLIAYRNSDNHPCVNLYDFSGASINKKATHISSTVSFGNDYGAVGMIPTSGDRTKTTQYIYMFATNTYDGYRTYSAKLSSSDLSVSNENTYDRENSNATPYTYNNYFGYLHNLDIMKEDEDYIYIAYISTYYIATVSAASPCFYLARINKITNTFEALTNIQQGFNSMGCKLTENKIIVGGTTTSRYQVYEVSYTSPYLTLLSTTTLSTSTRIIYGATHCEELDGAYLYYYDSDNYNVFVYYIDSSGTQVVQLNRYGVGIEYPYYILSFIKIVVAISYTYLCFPVIKPLESTTEISGLLVTKATAVQTGKVYMPVV